MTSLPSVPIRTSWPAVPMMVALRPLQVNGVGVGVAVG
jgi:hypothetical protein